MFWFSFQKLGDMLCKALLPKLACIPPVFQTTTKSLDVARFPFHTTTCYPQIPAPSLGVWDCHAVAASSSSSRSHPNSLTGNLAKTSLSERFSLRTQRDACSYLFSVSLQVIFYFLLIFQCQKCEKQAQVPYLLGSEHKTIGTLGLLTVETICPISNFPLKIK